jgi:hypothetical protein
MKALVLKSPWGQLIAEGHKTIEVRSWRTKYRGPLLIVLGKGIDREATLRQIESGPRLSRSYPQGHAIALAHLEDVSAFHSPEQEDKSGVKWDGKSELWAWRLALVRPIAPFMVKGRLGIFDVDLPAAPTPSAGEEK